MRKCLIRRSVWPTLKSLVLVFGTWSASLITALADDASPAGGSTNNSQQTVPTTVDTVVVAQNTSSSTTAAPPVEAVEVFGVHQETTLQLDRPTTSTRLDLSPLETPGSLSIVDGNLIRDLGIQSISQAKTEAPGVTSFSYPGNGGNSFANRGFYGDNSIKSLYDSIEIYNAGSTLTFPFDSWNVDHIEVLSGPASSLYGAGAIGGALNVIPKRPDPTNMSIAGQLSAGSFNTFHEAIDATGPIYDTGLAYRLDVSHLGSQGYTQNSPSDSTAASASLRYDVTSNLYFILSDDYGNQHQSPYTGTPTISNVPVDALRSYNYNVSDVILNFVDNWDTLATQWNPTDDISVHNDAYYLQHQRRYHDAYGYTYTPATSTVKVIDFRDIQAHEWQVGDTGYAKVETPVLGFKNSLVVGFDINDNSYYRTDNSGITTGSYSGSATVPALASSTIAYSAGVGATLAIPKYHINVNQNGEFIEDRLELTSDFSAVAGVRFDRYVVERNDLVALTQTKSKYNTIDYNVGLVYNPLPNVSVYGDYAYAADPVSSFSSLSVAQQAFLLSPGSQIEVGAKANVWDGLLEGTLAAYTIVKGNLLAPDPVNPSITDQVGSQSSHGIEGSLVLRPLEDVTIQANGTILSAKYDSFATTVSGKAVSLRGFQPVDVPDQSANVQVFWQFLPQFQFRTSIQEVGKRYIDALNTTPLPSFFTTSLGVRYAITPKYKLDVRMDNTFDKTYGVASPLTSQWILGAPRSVTVTFDAAL